MGEGMCGHNIIQVCCGKNLKIFNLFLKGHLAVFFSLTKHLPYTVIVSETRRVFYTSEKHKEYLFCRELRLC